LCARCRALSIETGVVSSTLAVSRADKPSTSRRSLRDTVLHTCARHLMSGDIAAQPIKQGREGGHVLLRQAGTQASVEVDRHTT